LQTNAAICSQVIESRAASPEVLALVEIANVNSTIMAEVRNDLIHALFTGNYAAADYFERISNDVGNTHQITATVRSAFSQRWQRDLGPSWSRVRLSIGAPFAGLCGPSPGANNRSREPRDQ
jgi:hypothetical protein